MLHLVDNRSTRDALLKVVEMQARLVEHLCRPDTKPEDVSPDWLNDVWHGVDAGIDLAFARRFCGNKTGPRWSAMRSVADAQHEDKHSMSALWQNQLGVIALYDEPSAFALLSLDLRLAPFDALKELLISFYEEWLKPSQGFPFASGTLSRASISEVFDSMCVCPYCDGTLRTAQLDHILPKSLFPCLSCHPENLVPVCAGCNSVQIKGDNPPLTLEEAEPGKDWFHPFHRSAASIVLARPSRTAENSFELTLKAKTEAAQTRVTKLDGFLKLSGFWGKNLAADIRRLPSRMIRPDLSSRWDADSVKDYCRGRSREAHRSRSFEPLAIYNEGLFGFAAEDDDVAQDILEQWKEDNLATATNYKLTAKQIPATNS